MKHFKTIITFGILALIVCIVFVVVRIKNDTKVNTSVNVNEEILTNLKGVDVPIGIAGWEFIGVNTEGEKLLQSYYLTRDFQGNIVKEIGDVKKSYTELKNENLQQHAATLESDRVLLLAEEVINQ